MRITREMMRGYIAKCMGFTAECIEHAIARNDVVERSLFEADLRAWAEADRIVRQDGLDDCEVEE